MINAQELRIKNLVYSPRIGYICRILSIVQEGSDTSAKCVKPYSPPNPGLTFLTFENMAGIPVTPEILEKCGFESDVTEMYELCLNQKDESPFIRIYPKYNMDYYLHNDDGDHCDDIKLLKPPQYLHQLQNLYFALTGEELTVQL